MKLEINKPQQETISLLKNVLPKAHMIDIKVRINGEDRYYEADWLKQAIKDIEL